MTTRFVPKRKDYVACNGFSQHDWDGMTAMGQSRFEMKPRTMIELSKRGGLFHCVGRGVVQLGNHEIHRIHEREGTWLTLSSKWQPIVRYALVFVCFVYFVVLTSRVTPPEAGEEREADV